MKHLPGADDMATCSHRQQDRSPHGGHGTDRNAQRLQNKKANQKQDQHDPAGPERGQILDRSRWLLQLGHVVGGRNIASEKQQQHTEAGQDRDDVDRHHHRCVVVEAYLEKVGGDDIHQIGYDQRQAGRVGNKPGGHHERQRCRRREAQRQQHGHHDGRENQGGSVIGKQGRNGGTQQHDESKQLDSAAATPAGKVQRGPFKESGLIQQKADDDDGDKGRRGIPDDIPDHRNIRKMHNPQQQRDTGSHRGAPANAKAAWLPDDQRQGEDENQNGRQH